MFGKDVPQKTSFFLLNYSVKIHIIFEMRYEFHH